MSPTDRLDSIRYSLMREMDNDKIPARLLDHCWSVTHDMLKAGMGSFNAIQEGLIYGRELQERMT